MNNPSKEHQDNVAFVEKFKEANKNTKYESVYDPIRKIRVMKPISVDPNLYQFVKENVMSESDVKNKRRREKAKSQYSEKPQAPKIPKSVPKIRTIAEGTGKKPKGEMRQNILELRNAGKSYREIGELYGTTAHNAKITYYREKKENENSADAGQLETGGSQ